MKYSLYRERRFLPDTFVGSVSHYLSSENNDRNPSRINKVIGDAPSDDSKYYLVTLMSDNGLEKAGSGRLTQ
ncbi:hypothetical protein [Amphibacillus sediminis]|uniref:hypothetical protein n=1 Tax=Amphibacillus sediminis TaxID=360185 RepID=UPI00082E4531|nr:hypothetical protein [Amphibacillus sediminis]